MRKLKIAHILVAGAILGAAITTSAQRQKDDDRTVGPFETTVMYQAMLSNPVGGSNFWLQGGSAQFNWDFRYGLSAVAELTGEHKGNINSSGVNLDLITTTFGPRYTWAIPHQRYSVYGQALVGTAFGMNSVFPVSSGAAANADGLAFSLGGGLNYSWKYHLSVRMVQADWLRTQLPNATTNVQNNLQLGTGLTMYFK